MKKVSIVVPVYNMGESLETCVESLLNQTYDNYEIILVNDGSKDNSGEVCDKLACANNIIQVVHTDNRGAGPARNAGIEKATGDYVYFPDADDYLEPDAISRMVDAMGNDGCDLVVFGFRYVNQNGETIRTKRYENSYHEGVNIRNAYEDYMSMTARFGIQGAPWNKFFDMRVIKQYGIEYPPLRRHQDDSFISRYMCYAKKVHFIEDVLYTYYVNDLQKEWQKYPVDYIDAVIGLYQVRKETICTWNPDDVKTHNLIEQEYICNVIKSLELSFSPKMNFTPAQRRLWIKQLIIKSGIEAISLPNTLGKYQRIVMHIIKRMDGVMLYSLLWLKVRAERNNLFAKIRNRAERN